VVVGGLLPFALADGPDLRYSLVTFHNSVAVNGGNLWTLVRGSALATIAQRADGAVVVVATLALAALVTQARPDLRIDSRDFYGLLALCSLCHPAFVNIFWPYYLLEAFTFCAIWWLAGIGALASARGRARWWLWAAAPVGVTLLGQARQLALAQQAAAASGSAPNAAAWDLFTCCALIVLMATLAWRLTRRLDQ
jgi:hypothetical protein